MNRWLFSYYLEGKAIGEENLTVIYAPSLSMAEFEFTRMYNDNPPEHEIFEIGKQVKFIQFG
jgi:hypothetical protein